MAPEPDWHACTNGQKAILGECLRRLKDRNGLTWAALFDLALDERVGLDYENHVRIGRIGGRRAAKLYSWLAQSDTSLAAECAARIGEAGSSAAPASGAAGQAWRRFLNNSRVHPLRVIARDDELQIAELSSGTSPTIIRLGQEFHFLVDVPEPCDLLAMQVFSGRHYLMPLGSVPAQLTAAGDVRIPGSQTGSTREWFWEREDSGLHRFIVAALAGNTLRSVSDMATAFVHPAALDRLAHELQAGEHHTRVWTCEVLFIR